MRPGRRSLGNWRGKRRIDPRPTFGVDHVCNIAAEKGRAQLPDPGLARRAVDGVHTDAVLAPPGEKEEVENEGREK